MCSIVIFQGAGGFLPFSDGKYYYENFIAIFRNDSVVVCMCVGGNFKGMEVGEATL